ncbi:MAG TPA: hypothetical protein PLT25_02155 [Acidocella sp.]|nr:hypothetical protein [Acidocella sp.]
MNDPSSTQPLIEWFIGILVTMSAGIGAVFFHIYGRIEQGDSALWNAFNKERDSTQTHREAIIKQVGALPTKEDFDKMEARIMSAIQRVKP